MRKVWEKIVFVARGDSAAGILLILSAVVALLIANSGLHETVEHFWHIQVAGLSVHHWINDGLMAIFFLAVGLEIRHELHDGALSSVRRASLPVIAALGGMVVPAALYFVIPHSADTMRGWAVPMATDIAFVAGVLSLLGNRVSAAAKIFVISLAVVDDIGAVLVIALLFTTQLNWIFIAAAAALLAFLFALRRLGMHQLVIYLAGGALLWWFTLKSGVHATVAGVLLATVIPWGELKWLEKKLKPWNAFLVMPLFALANAGEKLGGAQISWEVLFAVVLGLFVGKPLGILGFSWVGVRLKWVELPASMTWRQVLGVGCLGGIGFTMALFMAQLALVSEPAIMGAKLGILSASVFAAAAGVVILLKKSPR